MKDSSQGRARWALWTLVLALLLFTAWIALVYIGPMPSVRQFGVWNDKVLHIVTFALLALILSVPGPAPRALSVLAICGVLLELAQLAFPLRQASFADLIASLAGVVTGGLIGGVARGAAMFSAGKAQ